MGVNWRDTLKFERISQEEQKPPGNVQHFPEPANNRMGTLKGLELFGRSTMVILSTAQPLSSVLGCYGAIQLVHQSTDVMTNGYPMVFTSMNFNQGVDGMFYLSLAFLMSSLEWLVAFIYVISQCIRGAANSFPENSLFHQIRQFGFLLADMLTAWSFFNIASAHPSETDQDAHILEGVFGLDGDALNQLIPRSPGNETDVDENMAALLAFQITRTSISNMDWFLLVAGGARLFVVFIQLLTERMNVFYWVPCWRCNQEYHKDDTEKTQYGSLHCVHTKSCHVTCLKCSCTQCSCTKHSAAYPCSQFFALYWHNWRGALRNWLYLSCVFFFLGVWCQERAATGNFEAADKKGRFWPQIWPEGTDELNQLIQDAPIGNSTNIDLIKSLISETGVFPRNYMLLNPNINSTNDASYWAHLAAVLILVSELLRGLSGIGYFLGIVINESSVPGNHVAQNRLCEVLCP